MKEKILNHIREKAGLKRLELVNGNHWEGDLPDIYDFEIIGLPVQLNDLLRVVAGKVVIRLCSECLVFENNNESIKYDLTKSVEQNLNNPELLKLVGGLLNIK